MKTIDEIEKISLCELLNVAGDERIAVPTELKASMHRSVFPAGAGRTWILGGIAAAAALLIGVGLAVRNSGPKDTFDDPYLAYAELEKAFGMISDKANLSLDIINNAK